MAGIQKRKSAGYTLTELIAVLVIVGVVAAIAAPRFFETQGFDVRGYHDQTLAMLRYGQKIAIAQRRPVYVCFTAASVALGYDGACATPVAGPAGVPFDGVKPGGGAAPSGVTIAPTTNFFFDAGGRSSLAAQTHYQISGGGTSMTLTVERETGYVHP